jgi:hypothetical protein
MFCVYFDEYATEHHSQAVSISASYLEVSTFKSKPEVQLYWLRFIAVFASPFRQMLG